MVRALLVLACFTKCDDDFYTTSILCRGDVGPMKQFLFFAPSCFNIQVIFMKL